MVGMEAVGSKGLLKYFEDTADRIYLQIGCKMQEKEKNQK
jgi:hypothetical protein